MLEVPRYYFHIRRGRATVLDRDGVDLADVEEAAAEAARRGREMASVDAVVVADETWSPMFEIPLDDDGGD